MSSITLQNKLASARMGEYRGVSTAAGFSDVRAEYFASRSGCGVYDLGWRAKILLTGSDRIRWLNGVVTNNIRDLGVGHGVYAFLLNPQGHILGDLYAYHRGNDVLVDADRCQVEKMVGTFDHYIIMDDVGVANVSDQLTAIGLAGPESSHVLRTAGIDVPGLQPLELRDLTWQGFAVTLVRSDLPGEAKKEGCAYELWLAPENVSQMWDALVTAGARPAGSDAFELQRIALGIPRYGQDIRERDLPQETEQARALNFSKGCYVGQEIVERIRSRGSVHRKFTGFVIDGPLPVAGAKISAAGKDVGEITSVASLPGESGDRSVALGYIRREVGTPGKEVEIAGSRAVVARLPFADV